MKPIARTLLLGLFPLLFAGSIQAQACENPKIIRFSLIPKKNLASQATEYQPLAKALEESEATCGVDPGALLRCHGRRAVGGNVSLVDPASTSGALIPRQAINKLTGLPLERYFGRVTFASSHDRAIQAVQTGLVDVAFVYRGQLCRPVIDKIKQAFFQNKQPLQGSLRSMNAEGFASVSDDQYREIRDIYANQP
jgi:ABC-type phosphate/phosphonate transport system substrate-binding protein